MRYDKWMRCAFFHFCSFSLHRPNTHRNANNKYLVKTKKKQQRRSNVIVFVNAIKTKHPLPFTTCMPTMSVDMLQVTRMDYEC